MKHKKNTEQIQKIESHLPIDRFTSSSIRAMSRLGFRASMPHIISIATGEAEQATAATSIRAHDILGKWGMGDQPENIFIEARTWLTVIAQLAAKYFQDHADYDKFDQEVVATLHRMQ